MFEENGATYQLRNGNDFKIPRFRTLKYTVRKHYKIHAGPYLWSGLSREEESGNTLHSFISNIKRRDITSLLEDNCENCPLCLSYIFTY